MSMHPMKKQKPQAQVKVNLKEAETMKCDDCNNTLFIESYVSQSRSHSKNLNRYNTLLTCW